MAQVLAAIEEGGGPEALLQKLNSLETDMPGVGNKIGTALIGGVKGSFTGNAVVDAGILANMAGLDSAPAAGQQTGSAVGSAFGTGFTGNAVFDANTMVNNMGLNELPPKAGTIGSESGIALEQEFAKQIGSIVNTINTMQLKPIPIKADVSQAATQIGSIQNTLVNGAHPSR